MIEIYDRDRDFIYNLCLFSRVPCLKAKFYDIEQNFCLFIETMSQKRRTF